MYTERYNSISGIEAGLQRVHPNPLWPGSTLPTHVLEWMWSRLWLTPLLCRPYYPAHPVTSSPSLHPRTSKPISMSPCLWISPHPWHSHHFSQRASTFPCANILPSVSHKYCTIPASIRVCLSCNSVRYLRTLVILALSVPDIGPGK